MFEEPTQFDIRVAREGAGLLGAKGLHSFGRQPIRVRRAHNLWSDPLADAAATLARASTDATRAASGETPAAWHDRIAGS